MIKFLVHLLCTRCAARIVSFNLHGNPVVQERVSGHVSDLTAVAKQGNKWWGQAFKAGLGDPKSFLSPFHPRGYITCYSCGTSPLPGGRPKLNKIKGSERYSFWTSFPHSISCFIFLISIFYAWKFSNLTSTPKLKLSGKFNED